MGLFDRLKGRKPEPPTEPVGAPPTSQSDPESPTPAPEPVPEGHPGGVMPRLAEARSRLEAKDLPGALIIYEDVLAGAGDRADILVTISGDLGTAGHVQQIIELVAPRYDAARHGPATGLNLLQAYLAARDPTSAQHVLDILFSLKRPELEERLYGFSNVIAEQFALLTEISSPLDPGGGPESEPVQVQLISFSRPIWFYGLEAMEAELFPEKSEPLRRVAFGQLGLPGQRGLDEAMSRPEDEIGRLSRAVPLWFAETFHVCPQYKVIATVGMEESSAGRRPALFGTEWSADNVTQLVNTSGEAIDYVFTGTLRHVAGDYELVMRVWEVRKFRERKQFSTRWTPGNADVALAALHQEVRTFMEWKPATSGLPYSPPASPRAWLDALGISAGQFLATKDLLPRQLLPPFEPAFAVLGPAAADSIVASLAWLTLRDRVRKLELGPVPDVVPLHPDPLVARAREILGG